MRLPLRVLLLLVLGGLALAALAAPGELRWSDPALKLYHAAASPDGSLLAVERGFGHIAIFRSADFTEVRDIAVADQGYYYVFSPDNALLAVSRGDQTRCYAVATGEQVGRCSGIARAFTAQGALVTTSGTRITFLDPRTGATQRTLAAIGEVVQLALSPTGETLAYLTAKTGMLVKTTGERVCQWRAETENSRVLAFSPDGSLLVGTTTISGLNVWRVADGSVARSLTAEGMLYEACITPDNATLFYAAADAVVFRMALADGAAGESLPMNATPQLLALAAGGTRLVAATQDHIAVWNPATNSTVAELDVPMAFGGHVAFSPDGTLLAATTRTGVALRAASDGALVRTLPCPDGASELAFAPDGATLAVISNTQVLVLRVADGGVQYTLRPPTRRWSRALAFSGDGKLLLVGSEDRQQGRRGMIDVWRMADGSLARTIDTGGEGLWCLAASANGNYAASGSQETRSVTVWNAFTGVKVRTLAEQDGYACAFTPAGDLLTTTGNELQLITPATGAVKRHIAERTTPCVLSADGATVISNGLYGNGPALVWSLASGQVLATLQIDTQAGGFALTSNGTLAATSTGDGLAVWQVK